MNIEETKLRKSLIETPELYTNEIHINDIYCGSDLHITEMNSIDTKDIFGVYVVAPEQIYSFMMLTTQYTKKFLQQIHLESDGSGNGLPNVDVWMFADCYADQNGEVLLDTHYSTNSTRQKTDGTSHATVWKFENFFIKEDYKKIIFSITKRQGTREPNTNRLRSNNIGGNNNKRYLDGWKTINQAGVAENFTTDFTIVYGRPDVGVLDHIYNTDVHLNEEIKEIIQSNYEHTQNSDIHLNEETIEIIRTAQELVQNFYVDILAGYTTETYNSLDLVANKTYNRATSRIRRFIVPCTNYVGKYFSSVSLMSGQHNSGHDFTNENSKCWFACECLDSSGNVVDTFFSKEENYQAASLTYTTWTFDNILIQPTYRSLRFSATTQKGTIQLADNQNRLSSQEYVGVDRSLGWGMLFAAGTGITPTSMPDVTIEIKDPQTRKALAYNTSKDWIVKVIGTQNTDGSITTPLTDFLTTSEIIYQYNTQAVMKYEIQPQNDSFTPLTVTGNTYWEIEYHISFEFPVDKQYLLDNGLSGIEDDIYPVIIPK